MCCMYCVVYIVLPYLNNKTGYEIQNQYIYLLLLISLCALIQAMYVWSVCAVCLHRDRSDSTLPNCKVTLLAPLLSEVLLWLFCGSISFLNIPSILGEIAKKPGSILKNTLLLSKMNRFISYYNSQPFNARESLIITPQIKSICSVWWRIFIRIFKDVKPTAHLQKGQGFHSEHKLTLSKECEETRVLASCERREDVLSCSDVYFVSQEVIV